MMVAKNLPVDRFSHKFQEMATEAMILKKVQNEPNKAVWLRLAGDMMASKNMEAQAITAYSKALSLEPSNPETLNNLAWLLLTCKDPSLRDPLRALTLARSAVLVQPRGYILDTLAEAYWANGFLQEAVSTEKKAALADPGQRQYYLAQINKFSKQTYKEAMKQPQTGDTNSMSKENVASNKKE
jgi:predicted Zn-dependent protease